MLAGVNKLADAVQVIALSSSVPLLSIAARLFLWPISL